MEVITTPIQSVRAGDLAGFAQYARTLAHDGATSLLLFDEGEAFRLHDQLLSELRKDNTGDVGLIVWLDGDAVTTEERFYAECRRAIPSASYMGSNLDALEDVLRGEAVSRDREQRTLWLWSHADTLFESNRAFFAQVFESLIFCAKEIGEGIQNAYRGEFIPPRQKVTLIITGLWKSLGSEASRGDSFINAFKGGASLQAFPGGATGVMVVRIQR